MNNGNNRNSCQNGTNSCSGNSRDGNSSNSSNNQNNSTTSEGDKNINWTIQNFQVTLTGFGCKAKFGMRDWGPGARVSAKFALTTATRCTSRGSNKSSTKLPHVGPHTELTRGYLEGCNHLHGREPATREECKHRAWRTYVKTFRIPL